MDASGGPSRDVHEELFDRLHTSLARCSIESGSEAGSCVVIDALVGTSLSRPLEGVIFHAAMRVNAARNARLSPQRMHILAADIPSGVSSESGLIGSCVHADSTLTFVACKPAFGLSDVRSVTGPIRLATLDVPPSLIDRVLQGE
jgi:NAD(P)H-hydrate repair Nnr-like enzyme with NAD(P)H-hydrate epimerase domain